MHNIYDIMRCSKIGKQKIIHQIFHTEQLRFGIRMSIVIVAVKCKIWSIRSMRSIL